MSDEAITAAQAPASKLDRAADVRLPSWASIVVGAVLLLLVLGGLGRPSVFADTASYMLSGKEFWKSVAAPFRPSAPAKPVSGQAARVRQIQETLGLSVLASRQPWYGVFAWPLERVGTLWLLAAVQCGLAAWTIWLTWRVLAAGAPSWTAYAVQGASAGFSTLPFIAGMAMPDVFAPLMIMAVTLLLLARDRLHRNERTGLFVIVCFTTMAHGGTLLVAGAMIGLTALMALRGGAMWRPIFAVIGVLALGVFANAMFALKIGLIHHQAPGRPPFVAARLLADGPGRAYLRDACARGEPYLLCRRKAEPLNDIQAILWSSDDTEGVFSVSTPAERTILQRQEGRFVIGTVLHDPVGVAASVAMNWVKLLSKVYTEAPLIDQRVYLGHPENYPAEPPRTDELYLRTWSAEFFRGTALPGIIRRLGDCTSNEPACQPRLTIAGAVCLQTAEFLAACMALAFLSLRAIRRSRDDGLWLQALALVAFAIVVNALVFGGISGPFARYQSAIAWLPAMMAAVGACSMAKRSRG